MLLLQDVRRTCRRAPTLEVSRYRLFFLFDWALLAQQQMRDTGLDGGSPCRQTRCYPTSILGPL